MRWGVILLHLPFASTKLPWKSLEVSLPRELAVAMGGTTMKMVGSFLLLLSRSSILPYWCVFGFCNKINVGGRHSRGHRVHPR